MRLIERRESYWVTGSTREQLAESMALLGPRRGKQRYAAYTDWELRWSMASVEREGGFGPGEIDVCVLVTITMPRWHPPPTASPSLVETWQLEMRELLLHEEGHRDIATAAGRALREALEGLSSMPSREALDNAAHAEVRRIVDSYRAREIAYDTATIPQIDASPALL